MPVPGDDSAGLGSVVFWPELISEGKEIFLEKMKANSTIFEFNFIVSKNFISEWALSLNAN